MGSAKKQGELWGQAPSDWALLQEPNHIPLFEAMLNVANVSKGTQILDAGCGGGTAILLAAERGAKVSGLDAAEGLINVARERVASGDFRVGDIEDLPFEDNSFDVVFAANSVQYAADRVAALRELKRVCIAGGRITVGLFGPPENVVFSAIQKAIRNSLPEPPQGKGAYELSAPGKLDVLFEEADLPILKSGVVDCPFHYSDFETFWRAMTSTGNSQVVIQVVGREKFKSVLQEAAEPYLASDGSIEIGPNAFKYIVATV